MKNALKVVVLIVSQNEELMSQLLQRLKEFY